MPIIPSHVGGSGPRDEKDYEGSADTVRLRQLCEVLLTSRAKMLGLSQSFAHRLSSLPSDLKSSLVNGLGEIIAHLDSFEIKLGDTRLTGKVRLGADAGMEGHFPRGEIVSTSGFSTDDAARRPRRQQNDRDLGAGSSHPALPAPGGTARRRRRMATGGGSAEGESFSAGKAYGEELKRDDPEELARRRSAREQESEDDATYGHLYRLAQERRRQGLNRQALSRLQHGLLCWVTLAAFTDDPERPEAPYEAREAALKELEEMGYVRRVGRKWGPTPSGFEASGLVGTRGLELDP